MISGVYHLALVRWPNFLLMILKPFSLQLLTIEKTLLSFTPVISLISLYECHLGPGSVSEPNRRYTTYALKSIVIFWRRFGCHGLASFFFYFSGCLALLNSSRKSITKPTVVSRRFVGFWFNCSAGNRSVSANLRLRELRVLICRSF